MKMKILLLGVMLFFSTIASAEKYEEPKTVELTTNSEKLQQGPRTPIHIRRNKEPHCPAIKEKIDEIIVEYYEHIK